MFIITIQDQSHPGRSPETLRHRDPGHVRKLGYNFSAGPDWRFPSAAQAAAKIRVLENHFEGCPFAFAVQPVSES